MNFVKPEDEDANIIFQNDEPPFIKLIKHLNQKIKLTYEVVKKNEKFSDTIQYKKYLFDVNTLNENFIDPNLFSPSKHIIYNDFKEEIKKRTENADLNNSKNS